MQHEPLTAEPDGDDFPSPILRRAERRRHARARGMPFRPLPGNHRGVDAAPGGRNRKAKRECWIVPEPDAPVSYEISRTLHAHDVGPFAVAGVAPDHSRFQTKGPSYYTWERRVRAVHPVLGQVAAEAIRDRKYSRGRGARWNAWMWEIRTRVEDCLAEIGVRLVA